MLIIGEITTMANTFQGIPDNDPTGAFQRSARDTSDDTFTGQEDYRDPNGPMNPDKIPPHMRHFIKIAKRVEDDEYSDSFSMEPSDAQQTLSDDDGPRDLPEIFEAKEESDTDNSQNFFLDSDDMENQPDNVLGTDIQTGEKIIRPSKPLDNPFALKEENTKDVYSGGKDIASILAHLKSESDYHPYVLPSRGILYPKASQLSDGKVLIRPMRGQDEEILLTQSLIRNGEAIEMILKRCISFADRTGLKDPLEMLTQDRIAALIVIRGLTYGENYECRATCGRCGTTFQSNVSLENDLEVHYAEDSNLREPFETILPDSRLPVKYRLPRGLDERKITEHMELRRKKNHGRGREDSTTFRALMLTTEIAGLTSKEDRAKILDVMTLRDRAHLRDCFNYPPFGVDTRVNFICPSCNADNPMRLPLGVDFFIPQRAGEM
jgi:hypothetical protein